MNSQSWRDPKYVPHMPGEEVRAAALYNLRCSGGRPWLLAGCILLCEPCLARASHLERQGCVVRVSGDPESDAAAACSATQAASLLDGQNPTARARCYSVQSTWWKAEGGAAELQGLGARRHMDP